MAGKVFKFEKKMEKFVKIEKITLKKRLNRETLGKNYKI